MFTSYSDFKLLPESSISYFRSCRSMTSPFSPHQKSDSSEGDSLHKPPAINKKPILLFPVTAQTAQCLNPSTTSQLAILHSAELCSALSQIRVQIITRQDSSMKSRLQLSFGVPGQLLMWMSFLSWRDTQLSQLRLVGISPTISHVSVSSQYLSIVS